MTQSITASDRVSANYRYIAAYNEVNSRIAQRQHALSMYITNSKSIRENLQKSEKVKKPKRSSLRGQEHLANERTHQAWMRTAIALMGFGVIILRLRSAQISSISRPGLG